MSRAAQKGSSDLLLRVFQLCYQFATGKRCYGGLCSLQSSAAGDMHDTRIFAADFPLRLV